MVRYRRNFVPGGTHFFTVTLADRQSRTLVEHIVALREAFRTTRNERPFAIDAIVILPDHLPVVMTFPSADSDFSSRWQRIKGRFTRAVVGEGLPIGRSEKGEYSLWQRRFWEHTIRDEEDFSRHVDYIHYNPVKHRLVKRVVEWPYSSFHRYVRLGALPQDWAGTIPEDGTGFGERRG